MSSPHEDFARLQKACNLLATMDALGIVDPPASAETRKLLCRLAAVNVASHQTWQVVRDLRQTRVEQHQRFHGRRERAAQYQARPLDAALEHATGTFEGELPEQEQGWSTTQRRLAARFLYLYYSRVKDGVEATVSQPLVSASEVIEQEAAHFQHTAFALDARELLKVLKSYANTPPSR